MGDLGLPTIFLLCMNVECLYLDKMGVENAVYAYMNRQNELKPSFPSGRRVMVV